MGILQIKRCKANYKRVSRITSGLALVHQRKYFDFGIIVPKANYMKAQKEHEPFYYYSYIFFFTFK